MWCLKQTYMWQTLYHISINKYFSAECFYDSYSSWYVFIFNIWFMEPLTKEKKLFSVDKTLPPQSGSHQCRGQAQLRRDFVSSAEARSSHRHVAHMRHWAHGAHGAQGGRGPKHRKGHPLNSLIWTKIKPKILQPQSSQSSWFAVLWSCLVLFDCESWRICLILFKLSSHFSPCSWPALFSWKFDITW